MAKKNNMPMDAQNPEMEKYGVRTTAREVRKRKLLLRITVIILALLLLFLAIFFGCVTYANQAGRFTVNLDPDAIEKYGITLCENYEQAYGLGAWADGGTGPDGKPSADSNYESGVLIRGTAVENMDNITEEWIPADVDSGNHSGSHNGDANKDGEIDYIAYTFYLKNVGREDADYNVSIDVLSVALGADEAVRVKVYRNGEAITYGKKPVKGTENDKYAKFGIDKFFAKENKVMDRKVTNFKSGAIDKYTVLVWLEGWDPECVDDIMGGEVKLSMNFHIIDKEAENEELV